MKQIALVSGSSSGIGWSIAEKLANSGYKVWLNGRNAETLDLRVRSLREKGLQADKVVGDFTVSSSIQVALKTILTSDSKIDLLVGNLGSGKSLQGWDIPLEEYQRMFQLNLFAAIDLCTQVLRTASPKNIVLISSIAGVESLAAPIPYKVAKSALLSYMKSLSDSLASQGIRVNAISPGNVLFPGSTWEKKMADNPEGVDAYIKTAVPLKSFVKPEEIADAVLFLNNTPSLTGHNLIIDGGQIRRLV
ncbi:MAG: SDR family oxidoreductase [Bdellovibrionaceae bacterium]|nr:SDR family oxidoreductase [Pseudobdellovibrionaceae bacterium]